jgi:hypothetical protein
LSQECTVSEVTLYKEDTKDDDDDNDEDNVGQNNITCT